MTENPRPAPPKPEPGHRTGTATERTASQITIA
jgi:hypothetical protein